MDEQWIMHHGDTGGETRQLETAAVLATLVSPEQTAVRIERATEVRTDAHRVVFLLNPGCLLAGEYAPTSAVRSALLDGSLPAEHPAMDCRAGILNAHAVLDWKRSGRHYRLAHEQGGQRTRYEQGSPELTGVVETIATHSLAKAAALGRLGMALYNVVGSPEAPQYIVHRRSVGMLDSNGLPITYDAAELIMGEIRDELDLDHPFMLAYRARLNYELLQAEVAKQTQLLIVTPDIIKKGAAYDPGGLHSYISPDAPGHVWDQVEKHFFG